MTTQGKYMAIFRDAKHYSKNSSVQASESRYLIDKLNICFKNKKVLDVGCGDGKVSHSISNMGATVTGVDASIAMVEFASERYPNCQFIHQKAEELQLHNSKYDIITSFNCLHWIANIEKALGSIRSRLNAEGTFIGLIYPRCDELWEAAEWCESLPGYTERAKSFRNPYNFHTKEKMFDLLSDAGFQNIEIWQEERQTVFFEVKRFKDYIIGWLPHCSHFGHNLIHDWYPKYAELSQQKGADKVVMSYKTIFFIAS